MIFDSFWASFCAGIPSVSALHRCYIFYKLKARPATSKSLMTCFIMMPALLQYLRGMPTDGVGWRSNFVLLHVAVELSQHQLWKRLLEFPGIRCHGTLLMAWSHLILFLRIWGCHWKAHRFSFTSGFCSLSAVSPLPVLTTLGHVTLMFCSLSWSTFSLYSLSPGRSMPVFFFLFSFFEETESRRSGITCLSLHGARLDLWSSISSRSRRRQPLPKWCYDAGRAMAG